MTWAPRYPLGDLVEFAGGGTPLRTNPDYFGGHVPWVTPKDMKAHVISDSSVRLSAAGLVAGAAKLIAAPAVLVVVRSGILKHRFPVGVTDRSVALNQDMKALLPKPDLDAGYLARVLRANEPMVLSWVRGTTAENIPLAKLASLEIPLPPLDEQRRIADVLDRADALRAKRRETLDRLGELSQSIFMDLFSGAEVDSWEPVPLRELASAGADTIRTGPFGSQLRVGEFIEEGIPVLGIDNVVDNRFESTYSRFISRQKYRTLARYTVRPGDVLITIMGTCGRVAVVPSDVPTAISTKHLCCITPDSSKVLSEYLRAFILWHPSAARHINRNAKGAIMSGLNMGIIKTIPVNLPPLSVQRDVDLRLQRVRELTATVQDDARALDALFTSLQQRAFRGELFDSPLPAELTHVG